VLQRSDEEDSSEAESALAELVENTLVVRKTLKRRKKR